MENLRRRVNEFIDYKPKKKLEAKKYYKYLMFDFCGKTSTL